MKNWIEKILQFLLPKDDVTLQLEQISAEELKNKARYTGQNLHKDTSAIFDYRNPLIRNAVWQLKYRGNKKIARLLSECVHEEIIEEIGDKRILENFQNPIIIPMPISKERRKERGFNQCELITENLKSMIELSHFEISNDSLLKTKDTASQTKMDRIGRLKNLSGCFEIKNPSRIKGRNVILIDDVTTTGATFEEAEKTLISNGARKILKISIAH